MKPAMVQPTEAEREAVTLLPMTPEHLDAVLAIEVMAYSHPWSRGVDRLLFGHEGF